MRASRTHHRLIGAGFLLAFGLASCGSSPASSMPTGPPAIGSGACNTAPTKTVLIPSSQRSPAGKAGSAPTVVVPKSTPPSNLECADLIYGSGSSVKTGSLVTVQYVLATYSTHQVIQSSWTSQPYQLTVGVTAVVAGWTEGLIGMKVGGRRELIIPPSLGYGSLSPGAGISVNDTLVFVIDVLNIN